MLNVTRISALTVMVLCGALACSKKDLAKPAPGQPDPEVQEKVAPQPTLLDPAQLNLKLETVQTGERTVKAEAEAVKVETSRRYTLTQTVAVDQGKQDIEKSVESAVLFKNEVNEKGEISGYAERTLENVPYDIVYNINDVCLDANCSEVLTLLRFTTGKHVTDQAIRFKSEPAKGYVVSCAVELKESQFESKEDALKAMESACQPSSPSADEPAPAAQD